MKTIFIAHNYSEDSFSFMSVNLAHHLAEKGNRVVFISHRPFFKYPQTINKDKGEVIVCSWPKEKRPTGLIDCFWLIKMVIQYKPKVIIGHFVGSNISIMIYKLMLFSSVRTYVYYHTLTKQILLDSNLDLRKHKMLLFRKKIFYALFCNEIICPSELAKNDLQAFFGTKKGVVVLNPTQDRFKSKCFNNTARIIVSYLGRLDDSKGVLDLIEAFTEFQNKNPQSKIKLKIAGTGSQQKEIIKLVENFTSIEYCGGLKYDLVDEYLNQSNFVVIPSKYDALNMVGVESLMNATPVLISYSAGLADYLVDGVECIKFYPDIDSMVLMFEKLESMNQSEMSEFGRKKFLKLFGVEKYNEEISKLVL